MKRCERSSYKQEKKKLLEELWWLRIHHLIIRPTISFLVEYFK